MKHTAVIQEPVAWPVGSAEYHRSLLAMGKAMAKERSREIGDAWNQLANLLSVLEKSRTTLPAAPVQEHHGCACRWNDEGDRTATCERHQGWLEVIAEWAERARKAEAKLKAAPTAAQRPWVGLTGQQKELIERISVDVFDAMHRTEAKLKEKNT